MCSQKGAWGDAGGAGWRWMQEVSDFLFECGKNKIDARFVSGFEKVSEKIISENRARSISVDIGSE